MRAFEEMLVQMGIAGVGLVFAGAGGAKLANRDAFWRAVDSWNLFSVRGATVVSWVLPLAEVALGVGAVMGAVAGRGGGSVAIVIGVVLAAFAGVQSVLIVRGKVGDCGCLGSRGSLIGWWSVGRALSLAVVAFGLGSVSGFR